MFCKIYQVLDLIMKFLSKDDFYMFALYIFISIQDFLYAGMVEKINQFVLANDINIIHSHKILEYMKMLTGV